MFFKSITFCYLKLRKQLPRITATAVISRKHICSNGFSKTSWTADTDIFLHGMQDGIGIIQQTSFIYINIWIDCLFESAAIRIQINSHCTPPIFSSAPIYYHLLYLSFGRFTRSKPLWIPPSFSVIQLLFSQKHETRQDHQTSVPTIFSVVVFLILDDNEADYATGLSRFQR